MHLQKNFFVKSLESSFNFLHFDFKEDFSRQKLKIYILQFRAFWTKWRFDCAALKRVQQTRCRELIHWWFTQHWTVSFNFLRAFNELVSCSFHWTLLWATRLSNLLLLLLATLTVNFELRVMARIRPFLVCSLTDGLITSHTYEWTRQEGGPHAFVFPLFCRIMCLILVSRNLHKKVTKLRIPC